MENSTLAKIQEEIRLNAKEFFLGSESRMELYLSELVEVYNSWVNAWEVLGFSVKPKHGNVIVLTKDKDGACQLVRFFMLTSKWEASVDLTSDTVDGMAIQLLEYNV